MVLPNFCGFNLVARIFGFDPPPEAEPEILFCGAENREFPLNPPGPLKAGVDFLAFPPINIGEIYKKIFDLRKVISQSEILFDLKQLHQLSVGL